MTFGSLFAGVGGFDLAFERAGMRPAWQVEIDRDANRVLAHHWPDVPRHEDVAVVGRRNLPRADVICGGFPCQDLSVAGKRAGLGGERSGLFYEMLRVVHELRPRFLVWENVPGLLSSFTPVELPPVDAVEGREWEVEEDSDFEAVLGALAGVGYFGAWRVLDAQFFGVAQRRERVFGVFAPGRSGAGRAAEVLALAEGRGRHPAAGRQTRADVAGTVGGGAKGRGWSDDLDRAGAFVAATVRSRSSRPGVNPPGRGGEDDQNIVYQCHGNNVGPMGAIRSGNGGLTGGVPFTAVAAESGNRSSGPIDVSTAVNACRTASGRQDFETETFVVNAAESCAVERHARPSDVARCLDQTGGFTQGQGGTLAVNERQIVRRLTPTEYARLQGFSDDWLDLDPPLSDSAKYRLLGNAVAVPVVEWIGRRLARCIGKVKR